MNARKAKALRREAEVLTIGEPARDYQYQQGTIIRRNKNVRNGTIELTPNCTRSVYKGLKRKSKR